MAWGGVTWNGTHAPSSRELVEFYRAHFYHRIAAGDVRPVVLPYFLFTIPILVLYLCIPHTERPWVYRARWLVLGVIILINGDMITGTTTMGMGTGFGVGLIAAWGIVWSMVWLVWNALQWDARRVEVQDREIWLRSLESQVAEDQGEQQEESTQGMPNIRNIRMGGPSSVRHRLQRNGHANGAIPENDTLKNNKLGSGTGNYYWQSFPAEAPFKQRLDWTLDLILNFRGPAWTWEISTNPPLPPFIPSYSASRDGSTAPRAATPTGRRRFQTRAQLAWHIVPRFIIGYLLLDALKTSMMLDPYFKLGPPLSSSFPPPPYLACLPEPYLTLLRRLMALAGVITALETIFALAPISFCLLCGPASPLGDVLQGWGLGGLRSEPWYFPETWGILDVVMGKGLEGLWGGWWHQTFRVAFAAPTKWLVRTGWLPEKAVATQVVGLGVAFGTSAFLHGSGSYTQTPRTNPWEPVCFFMLQVMGIGLQRGFCAAVDRLLASLFPIGSSDMGTRQRHAIPETVRRAANFAWTFTWLYITCPLLIDDFARGGVWLFQPVPVSLFRGLGWGEEGEGWWCWGGVRWWWQFGGWKFWDTGVAG
jgi:hypothetical protein